MGCSRIPWWCCPTSTCRGWTVWGLLQRVKERFPDLPVFMVTAYADDDRRRQATRHGAEEFLAKPVDFQALKQQLDRLPR